MVYAPIRRSVYKSVMDTDEFLHTFYSSVATDKFHLVFFSCKQRTDLLVNLFVHPWPRTSRSLSLLLLLFIRGLGRIDRVRWCCSVWKACSTQSKVAHQCINFQLPSYPLKDDLVCRLPADMCSSALFCVMHVYGPQLYGR